MNPEAHELARHAALLLENPAAVEAFRRLEDRCRLAWETTKPDDTAGREDAFRALRAIQALRAQLKSLTDAPKVTAFNARARSTGS